MTFKKIVVVLSLGFFIESKAQFVVSDPGADASLATQVGIQSTQLTNIIEGLRIAKESYSTYTQMQQELAFLKQQTQTTEARLHDLSQMNGINVNQLLNVLERYTCLMGSNYYFLNTNYLMAVNMLLSGLISCNSDQLYLTTFSGMKKKIIDNNMWSPINYSGNPSQDIFNINQQKQSFQTTQLAAYRVHDASQTAYNANTLDASVKMKALAKSLDSLGTQCIKKSQDASGNLSEYERISLYSKGLELHVKATETINRAYQMEKEGTGLSSVDAQTMLNIQKQQLTQECLSFRQ